MFDLKNVLDKIETLNTPKEKLEFINQKLEEALNYSKDKGYIKLLSSNEEKLLLEFIEHLGKLKSTYEKRLKNIKIDKKVELKIRTKHDYIIWIGKRSILENLLNLLIFKKYILDYKETEINKIINEHFYIEGYTEIKNSEPRKMRWSKGYPQLLYLFESLYNIKHNTKVIKEHTQLLDSKFWDTRHSIVSKHFINYKGEPIDNEVLARSEHQYKKDDLDAKPKNYELIDEIIEETFTDSI
jgi:hypothetical protein